MHPRGREGAEEARNLRRAHPSLGDGSWSRSSHLRGPRDTRSFWWLQGRGRQDCRREVARAGLQSPCGSDADEDVAAARSSGLTWRRGVAPLATAVTSPRRTEWSAGSREGPRLDRIQGSGEAKPRRASAAVCLRKQRTVVRTRGGSKASKQPKPPERGDSGASPSAQARGVYVVQDVEEVADGPRARACEAGCTERDSARG